MNPMPPPAADADPQGPSRLLDVLIRAGLIGALAVLCYQVLSPFLTLMAWSIILAVTLYPWQQWLARRLGAEDAALLCPRLADVLEAPRSPELPRHSAILAASATAASSWPCASSWRTRSRVSANRVTS